MSDNSAGLRAIVVRRAEDRCEYCGLAQAGQEAAFHIDHVLPRAEGGPTTEANLALACVSCSLRKGATRSAIDPNSGSEVPLFNPRTQFWAEHFRWDGGSVVAITPAGRATVGLLAMNRAFILQIHKEERARNRHRPTGNAQTG